MPQHLCVEVEEEEEVLVDCCLLMEEEEEGTPLESANVRERQWLLHLRDEEADMTNKKNMRNKMMNRNRKRWMMENQIW